MRSSARRPDFVIIGEMKCGTTTLWRLLERHPGITFPRVKELHGLGSYTINGAPGLRWDQAAIASYLGHFSGIADSACAGEATPDYLYDREAPRRLFDLAPGAKLIMLLREPISRAYSHYWHQVRRGREQLSFARALAAEDARIRRSADDACMFSYRARGRYIESIRRWMSFFPPTQCLVIFQRDLIDDSDTTLALLTTFLALDRLDSVGTLPHENRTMYNGLQQELFKQRVKALLTYAPTSLENAVGWVADRTRQLRASRSQSIPDRVRSDMLADYKLPDRELEQWLGRPVPWLHARTPERQP